MLSRICITLIAATIMVVAVPDESWAAKSGGGHGHGVDTHAGADMKTLEDPSELKWDLAIYSGVVFALLLVILWKFAWGPICEGLEKREKRIADNITAAEEAGEDARKLIAQYQDKLDGAAGEVRELLEEARRDAEQAKAQIVAEAKASADEEWQRTERKIETATVQALKELAEASADNAIDLAGRIVQAQLSKEDHAALITQSIQRFRGSPSEN